MNKKLVAVAVASVLAAPLAAQAQTANVTLYGRLNMTVELVNGVGCATVPGGNGAVCDPNPFVVQPSNQSITRVSSNSSRLGVRGTESLGGGLNAIFQIESNVGADIGAGTFASRDTFVGLQGGWGTMRLGNFNAPYDDIHVIFGNVPTLTTSILSTATLWGQGQVSKAQGGFDARLGNSIRYDTPNISGFVGSGQISLGENNTNNWGTTSVPGGATQPHAYVGSLATTYTNGPAQVGVGYEFNSRVRGAALNDYAITVAGAWNFGLFRLGAVYQGLKYEQPSGDIKQNMYGFSGTAPIGPGTLYAFWGHVNDATGSCSVAAACRVGGVTNIGDSKADQYEISYTYPLSKRTLLYAGYVGINNADNASYTFNINAYNQNSNGFGPIGGNMNGFVLGTVHFF
jgi:predicted porin